MPRSAWHISCGWGSSWPLPVLPERTEADSPTELFDLACHCGRGALIWATYGRSPPANVAWFSEISVGWGISDPVGKEVFPLVTYCQWGSQMIPFAEDAGLVQSFRGGE